jgi:hypothetical protein
VILKIGCPDALDNGQRSSFSDNFSEKNCIDQRKKFPYRLSAQAIGDYIDFSIKRLRTHIKISRQRKKSKTCRVKCPNLGFITGIALRLVETGQIVHLKGVCLKIYCVVSFLNFLKEFNVLSDCHLLGRSAGMELFSSYWLVDFYSMKKFPQRSHRP